MALLTRSADASIDAVSASVSSQISGGPNGQGGALIAGEALDAVAPCYIKASDGKVYMSNGTSANEAASIDGFTAKSRAAGQTVTLHGVGTVAYYADGGLTPGDRFFIGATAGRLDDGATTGDAVGVAKAINAYLIRIVRDA